MSLTTNYPTILPAISYDFANSRSLSGVGPEITFTRTGTATYFNSAGVLTTAAANEPRFDFDPVTLACRGLLIEEGRTNSISNSQAGGAVVGVPGTPPTNWVVSATSNGLSREIVATGTVNGLAYVDIRWSGTTASSSGTQTHFESATQIAATAGNTWTGSAYVQLVSGSLSGITWAIQNWYHDSGGVFIGFNQTAFTPTSSLVRVSHTGAVAATATRIRNCVQFFYGSGQAIDLTLRIAAPQLEQGAFATSYIPTTSAAVTRGADNAVITSGNALPIINQNEGTLFCEASRYAIQSSNYQNIFFRIGHTSLPSNASLESGLAQPTLQRFLLADTSGTTVANTGFISGVNNTVFKMAGVYKTDDVIFYQNGSASTPDTGATGYGNFNSIFIGSAFSATYTNGHIRKVAYWNKRLPNAQLQALTT